MKDWNKMSINEYIEHLNNKFQFDSSGTAKAVFEVIKELSKQKSEIKELKQKLEEIINPKEKPYQENKNPNKWDVNER